MYIGPEEDGLYISFQEAYPDDDERCPEQIPRFAKPYEGVIRRDELIDIVDTDLEDEAENEEYNTFVQYASPGRKQIAKNLQKNYHLRIFRQKHLQLLMIICKKS